MLWCGCPLHHGLFHRLKWNLLWHLEHLLPSFLTNLGIYRSVSPTSFVHPSHHHEAFCSFLNMLSQKHHHLGCRSQLCSVVGPLKAPGTVWNHLEPSSPPSWSVTAAAVPAVTSEMGISNFCLHAPVCAGVFSDSSLVFS